MEPVPELSSIPEAPAAQGGGAAGLRRYLMPLALTGLISYFDYLTHRSAGSLLPVAVAAGVVLLSVAGKPFLERSGLKAQFDRIPTRIRPILYAIPPVLWFAIRDEGTSSAGLPVAFTGLGLVAVTSLLGPEIDRALEGFYASRNRVLPRGIRTVLAIVFPLLVSLVVIHGSLGALPVFFQGTTSSAQAAAGRDGLIVFGALLSGVVAFLLIREQQT
jgi:hypothetical protein